MSLFIRPAARPVSQALWASLGTDVSCLGEQALAASLAAERADDILKKKDETT
jgi:hypothetical protein